jgi:hypothetical protein
MEDNLNEFSEEPIQIKSVNMNYNDFVNMKRNTEIGQTLYLKAKDIIEAEDVFIKK